MEDQPTCGKGLEAYSVIPREVATELIATASRMAGYRDLPMGKHDENMMSGQRSIEAFENFVKRLKGRGLRKNLRPT